MTYKINCKGVSITCDTQEELDQALRLLLKRADGPRKGRPPKSQPEAKVGRPPKRRPGEKDQGRGMRELWAEARQWDEENPDSRMSLQAIMSMLSKQKKDREEEVRRRLIEEEKRGRKKKRQ